MNRNTLFWGAILVLVGLLLLLDNLGIFNVSVWSLIWPLFLVALGIWILWGTVFRGRPPAQEQVTVPLEGAGQGRIHIRHGAGHLTIDGTAGSTDLATGSFRGGLDYRTKHVGDILDLEMHVPYQVFPWFWGPMSSLDWSLGLNPNIPITLDMSTGAGETQADLSSLRVSDLRLQTGASSTRLVLPANAVLTRANIEAGAASVNIRIPTGVAARIHVRSGLSGINVDTSRFPRQGDLYQSADYESAQNKVEVYIQSGVGSISIQ